MTHQSRKRRATRKLAAWRRKRPSAGRLIRAAMEELNLHMPGKIDMKRSIAALNSLLEKWNEEAK